MRTTHPDTAATHPPVRRMGLAFVVVVALLLGLPAAAGAFATEVVGETLFVRGNDEPETITLTVGPAGTIAVNGVETGLASGAAAEIEVTARGGSDTVDARALLATDYGSLEINGGEGTDVLTGGLGDEIVFGDDDADVIRGTPGNDFLEGGFGDDTITWANGDNNDEAVGGAGNDGMDLSGHPAAADILSFLPSPVQPGWILIKRQETATVKAFAIELLSVETTSIDTLGGDDFTANQGPVGIGALTRLIIHGGEGLDQIGGSNGDDLLDGGPGNDLVAGAAGNDLLVGSTGNDRLVGEEGDDRMVWNNGDNNDEDIGGFGDDEVVLSGHPTERDQMFFKPSEIQFGWVSLQRDEVGPVKAFTIELLEVEDFFIDALGGNDLVAQEGPVGIGALTRLHLQGGAGPDVLTGSSDGNDEIDGGEGADELFVRDAKADLVVGGPGQDFAFTDALTIDSVREVEAIDAAPEPEEPEPERPGPEKPQPEGPRPPNGPAPDTMALLPTLGKLSLVGPGTAPVAMVPVTCPAAESGGCRTTVTVETAKPVRLGARRAVLRLGAATAELGPGATKTVRIRLSRRTVTLFKRLKLPVRIRIASTDAAGNRASGSVMRVLRLR